MKRESITEPKFGKIFALRFLISLVVFSVVAAIILGQYYNEHSMRKYDTEAKPAQDLPELARSLSEAEPGSDEYKEIISQIRIKLAIYQSNGKRYAEVRVGDLKLNSDTKDFIMVTRETGKNYKDYKHEFYFLKDPFCYDPVNKYAGGKYDIIKINEKFDKYQWDWAARYFGLVPDVFYRLETAYVNYEDGTFVPGVVVISDKDKEYKVDCTPADLSGYELLDCSTVLCTAYGNDTNGLTSSDVNECCVPDDNGYFEQFYDYEDNFDQIKNDTSKAWYVGYADYTPEDTVFTLAPVTSTVIIIAALFCAAISGTVLSVIRYQKDKTIWEIFDYRNRTTEAMAHDLKTPLASIMAYSENLEESADDRAKVIEYSGKITDKVTDMNHMIEDILVLSKTGTAKADISLEDVDVLDLVKESALVFPGMKTDINGNGITIRTDRKLFKQAIDNLLSNCDRYGEKGSPVIITLTSDSLTVTNKTSMTYKDVDSLKDPFIKGDSSRGSKGTGLGLSIADNNLKILGYKLELKSVPDLFTACVIFKTKA